MGVEERIDGGGGWVWGGGRRNRRGVVGWNGRTDKRCQGIVCMIMIRHIQKVNSRMKPFDEMRHDLTTRFEFFKKIYEQVVCYTWTMKT